MQEPKLENINKEEVLKRFIKNSEEDYFTDKITERWIISLDKKDELALGKIQMKLKQQRSLLEFLYELQNEKDY